MHLDFVFVIQQWDIIDDLQNERKRGKKTIENNNKSTFNSSSSNDDDHNSDNDDQSSLFRNTPIRIKLNSKVFFLFARLEK